MSDDDELALDEMQSFAGDIALSDSDSEGEALDWPVGCAAGTAADSDDDVASADGAQRPQQREAPPIAAAAAAAAAASGEAAENGLPRALQPELEMRSRVDAMMSVEYWRELCPQLHVSDGEFARKAVRAVFNFIDDPDTVDELRAAMDRDGYVTMAASSEKLPWCVDLSAMAAVRNDGKRVFLRLFMLKISFFQDRLGKNIGKTQEKTVLSQGVKSLIEAGWPPMMLTVLSHAKTAFFSFNPRSDNFHQDRLGTNTSRENSPKRCYSQVYDETWAMARQKRPFLCRFHMLKSIFLPRQARDKHRKSYY